VPRAQPEPSRGARTLRTAPTRVWRPSSSRTVSRPCGRAGAPGVVAFRGEQEPQERRTRVPGTIRSAQASWIGEGERADTTWSSSEEEPNSTRGTHGASVPRVRHAEENPETVETVWGERRKPMRRYSTGKGTSEGDGNLTRAGRARATEPGSATARPEPLEGQGRGPQCAATRKGGGQPRCGPHNSR